jgi:hypothetical protein
MALSLIWLIHSNFSRLFNSTLALLIFEPHSNIENIEKHNFNQKFEEDI